MQVYRHKLSRSMMRSVPLVLVLLDVIKVSAVSVGYSLFKREQRCLTLKRLTAVPQAGKSWPSLHDTHASH